MSAHYRVTFEIMYQPEGVPLPLFFHPAYIVEANNQEHAKERAQLAFNSHPDNVKLNREIVEVELTGSPEDESKIFKLEDSQ